MPTASQASAASARGRSSVPGNGLRSPFTRRRPSGRVSSIVGSTSPSERAAPSSVTTQSTEPRSGTSPSTSADQRSSPAATCESSSSPSAGNASPTVAKYGPTYSARPSSSKSTASSRKPSPAPPSSSPT